ncbi:unnamed protein product [Schistosoma margrebowiei]|uniref:Uncharacterized protein n=1 Tax=Schistosoma margrebowiei TaxID=48269 RepID=A0A183NAR5_9TREM|nr:unnamed protein product [Schistosoma margrebowiei]
MMVGGSQQEILNLGFVLIVTHQQGVAISFRKLMLSNEFDPVLLSFTIREGTTELFG